MKTILPKKYRNLLYLSIFLILINLLVIYFYDLQVSRYVRLASTTIVLVYSLFYKGYKFKFLFVALLAFLIKDIFVLDYEDPFSKTMSFVFGNFAYILVVLLVLLKVKFKKSTPIILVFVLTLVILNVVNVFYLSDIIVQKLDNTTQYVLFMLQSVLLILLGLVGFSYNERYVGKTPLLFLYLVMSIIMCDLAGLAAYFFEFQVAFYFERIFYLLSLILLLNFSINRETQISNNLVLKEKEFIL
ncbi:hypothetical protein [Patiriisocius hiemis]|uniref:YhhN-like protein n=1 Tax=Patiriisocius hiemis TaxID=3075604 RepID=A0ABU2YD55_9FLAO|nr:hypothetical protein [Constantimarinum sp. W242]MDT0555942.1 hypothetical protein [Constantimarinum sp. W242]